VAEEDSPAASTRPARPYVWALLIWAVIIGAIFVCRVTRYMQGAEPSSTAEKPSVGHLDYNVFRTSSG